MADAPGVVTATLIEAGQVVAAGQNRRQVARLAEKKWCCDSRNLLARARSGEARVSVWSNPDKNVMPPAPRARTLVRCGNADYLAKFSILEAGR